VSNTSGDNVKFCSISPYETPICQVKIPLDCGFRRARWRGLAPLPPTSPGNHHPDGNQADHALTFKLDHSRGRPKQRGSLLWTYGIHTSFFARFSFLWFPRPLQKQRAYHWRVFTPANNQNSWPLQWWIIAPAVSPAQPSQHGDKNYRGSDLVLRPNARIGIPPPLYAAAVAVAGSELPASNL